MGAPQERSQATIRNFGGLDLVTDPHDLLPGQAVDQVNMACVGGAIESRPGMREVSFEETG